MVFAQYQNMRQLMIDIFICTEYSRMKMVKM